MFAVRYEETLENMQIRMEKHFSVLVAIDYRFANCASDIRSVHSANTWLSWGICVIKTNKNVIITVFVYLIIFVFF